MTLYKITKKQLIHDIIVMLILFAVLLLAGVIYLCIRSDSKWKPAPLTIKQAEQFPDQPYLNPNGMTQEMRILPPEGFSRVPVESDSFAAFLRGRAVYPHGTDIPVFDGTTQSALSVAAVYDMKVGAEGYQQCADSVIRLFAEYLYESGRKDEIAFHLSNGFLCDYASWLKGKRVLAAGEFSCWLPGLPRKDSVQTLDNYLVTVMRYAGTLSLTDESKTIPASEAHTGDFICRGGTPGHVMLIVDEAADENGNRCFLIGQGLIPSMSFHIVTNSDGTTPWFTEDELAADMISLGSYYFKPENLRRWNDGMIQK